MPEPTDNQFEYGYVIKEFVNFGGYWGNLWAGYGQVLEQLARNRATTTLELVESLAAKARELSVAAEAGRLAALASGNQMQIAANIAVRDFLAGEHAKLTDAAFSAEQRLAEFSERINFRLNDKLGGLGTTIGKYVGPAFDIAGVIDAIRRGDGRDASKAVISMGMAWLFASGIGALAVAASVPLTLTAILAGGGAVVASLLAEPINDYYGRPALDAIGEWFPDALWAGLARELDPSQHVGVNSAAFAEPVNAMVIGSMLQFFQPTITKDELAAMFSASGLYRERETVGLLNAISASLAPTLPMLLSDATDAEILNRVAEVSRHGVDLQAALKFEVSTVDLAISAKYDFASAVALLDLSPVVFRGAGPAEMARLDSHWLASRPGDFADWLEDISRPEEVNRGQIPISPVAERPIVSTSAAPWDPAAEWLRPGPRVHPFSTVVR